MIRDGTDSKSTHRVIISPTKPNYFVLVTTPRTSSNFPIIANPMVGSGFVRTLLRSKTDIVEYQNALLDNGSSALSYIDSEFVRRHWAYFANAIKEIEGVSQVVANGETIYATQMIVLELNIVDADGAETTFEGQFIILPKAVFTPPGQALMDIIIG